MKLQDTSHELYIQRLGNGITLVRPEQAKNHALRLAEVLNFPCNVFFLNRDSVSEQCNELAAEISGYSPKTITGKSIFDLYDRKSAEYVRENDLNIIRTDKIAIMEEGVIHQRGHTSTNLTIEAPWYDDKRNTIGTFGCSIVMNRDSLSLALIKIGQLGLLSPNNYLLDSKTIQGKLVGNNIYVTKREAECIEYLLQNYTAAKIATTLNLSTRTIEHYLENIKNKLAVSSKLELLTKLNAYILP